MSINSISDIYSRVYTSQINKANSTDETEAAANSSGTTSLADILELGSSEDDLSTYLNYDASGNYSSLPTLVDYLSSDSDGNDLLSNLQSNTNSLTDVLYSDSSENSTSGIFDLNSC
jgi:hypothetical protein